MSSGIRMETRTWIEQEERESQTNWLTACRLFSHLTSSSLVFFWNFRVLADCPPFSQDLREKAKKTMENKCRFMTVDHDAGDARLLLKRDTCCVSCSSLLPLLLFSRVRHSWTEKKMCSSWESKYKRQYSSSLVFDSKMSLRLILQLLGREAKPCKVKEDQEIKWKAR